MTKNEALLNSSNKPAFLGRFPMENNAKQDEIRQDEVRTNARSEISEGLSF